MPDFYLCYFHHVFHSPIQFSGKHTHCLLLRPGCASLCVIPASVPAIDAILREKDRRAGKTGRAACFLVSRETLFKTEPLHGNRRRGPNRTNSTICFSPAQLSLASARSISISLSLSLSTPESLDAVPAVRAAVRLSGPSQCGFRGQRTHELKQKKIKPK